MTAGVAGPEAKGAWTRPFAWMAVVALLAVLLVAGPLAPRSYAVGGEAAYRAALAACENTTLYPVDSTCEIEITASFTISGTDNDDDPSYFGLAHLSIFSSGAQHTISRANGSGPVRFLLSPTSPGSVIVENLAISGFTGGNSPGGAIYASGAVDVVDVVFSGNTADNGPGGAIFTNGSVEVSGSEFLDNTVTGSGSIGGAIFAADGVEVEDSEFSDNTAGDGPGGAIFAGGAVEVSGSEFSDNTAGDGPGGAIFAGGAVEVSGGEFSDNTAGGPGGAIFAGDAVEVADGVFSGNEAGDSGGAIFAGDVVEVAGGVFTGNEAPHGPGGAIYASGAVDVVDGEFVDNTAGDGPGGAIYASGEVEVVESRFSGNTNGFGPGGAIFASRAVTVVDSVFEDNETTSLSGTYGGAVYSGQDGIVVFDSVFTRNKGSITSSGGALYAYEGDIYVAGSLFEENGGGSWGGGAIAGVRANIFVMDSVFRGNEAHSGGAIHLFGGDVEVFSSEFKGNSATAGGAIYVQSDGEFPPGGGTVYVREALFEGNSAINDGGAIDTERGGYIDRSTFSANTAGIFGGAVRVSNGSLSVVNSTGVGNQVTGAEGAGGALLVWGDVSLWNVTLVGNSADEGAHLAVTGGDDVEIIASAFGPASTPGCDFAGGIVLSADYNWGTESSCFGSGGTVGSDPRLGPLRGNGGLTPTLAPLSGSPLIDAVPDQYCEEWDQRGLDRPLGSACDIGAVEALADIVFEVPTPNGVITVRVANALELGEDSPQWTATGDLPTAGAPADVVFPYGAFSFLVFVPWDEDDAQGWPVHVTATLPAPVNQWWKVDLDSGAWAPLPGAVFDGATVAFTLRDGGVGDQDGERNGQVLDPSAPGVGVSFAG